MKQPARFTLEDANRAHDEWGANCGPGAIAAVVGMTLDELRPHLGDFEIKGYTNPLMMWEILKRLHVRYSIRHKPDYWPTYGLARVQWEGPWTKPGVPARAAYRHTHWVGAWHNPAKGFGIFDINAMASGGWISEADWKSSLVPWLLNECVPRADGRWHLTHAVEVSGVGEP